MLKKVLLLIQSHTVIYFRSKIRKKARYRIKNIKNLYKHNNSSTCETPFNESIFKNRTYFNTKCKFLSNWLITIINVVQSKRKTAKATSRSIAVDELQEFNRSI